MSGYSPNVMGSLYFQLGRKLARQASVPTLSAVTMAFASEVLGVILPLLPLQIIIYLGSHGASRYLPQQLTQYDQNTVVYMLCFAIAVVFLLRAGAEKLRQVFLGQGTDAILKANNKTLLFNNQTTVAKQIYQQFTSSLGSLLLILAGAVGLGVYYPGVVLAYAAAALLGGSYVVFKYGLFIGKSNVSRAKFTKITGLIVYVSLISSYLFMAAQFLYFTPPHFMTVIAAAIIVRLVSVRLKSFILSIHNLNSMAGKVSALFFHDHIYLPAIDTKNDLWSLLPMSKASEWILPLIENCTDENGSEALIEWLQSNTVNVFLFGLTFPSSGRELLLKVFDAKKADLAKHEVDILYDSDGFPVAAELLNVSVVRGFYCHLFDVTNMQGGYQGAGQFERQLRTALFEWEPSDDLIQRYIRSKPLLSQRFTVELIEQLSLVANDAEMEIVDRFKSVYQNTLERLTRLPIVVLNPGMNRNWVLKNADGAPVCLHWIGWRLELAGCGWPLDEKSVADLREYSRSLIDEHARFSDIHELDLIVAAFCFSIEADVVGQKFKDAIVKLNSLHELVDGAENDI